MKRTEVCREEGCNKPPLDQAIFCGDHVGVKRRCKATRAGSGGERCKKSAMLGLEVCRRHGGSWPRNRAQSEKARVLTVMQRFVRPYEGPLDPVSAFEGEFRRTLGRIAWYDEQLGLLESATDLIWGRTKYETASGNEGIPNSTYEARVNILEEMQRWERKHLLELEKVWINAGLEEKRLGLLATYVEKTYELTKRALTELGLDPMEPKVRQVLHHVFLNDESASAPRIRVEQLPSTHDDH